MSIQITTISVETEVLHSSKETLWSVYLDGEVRLAAGAVPGIRHHEAGWLAALDYLSNNPSVVGRI